MLVDKLLFGSVGLFTSISVADTFGAREYVRETLQYLGPVSDVLTNNSHYLSAGSIIFSAIRIYATRS